MTREDIMQLNVVEPYCFESDREEQWYNVGLKNGLEIADEHPKSPWINVKNDLPCNHEDIVCKSWLTKHVFVRLVSSKNGCILYTTNFMIHNQIRKTWMWACSEGKCDEEYEVTHWMAIPNLPKEQEIKL